MSILLPPLFTTIRVNKLIDPEKKNIEKEIKSHLQQVYKEHQLHVEPTVYRHAILEDVCVIPSVRRSVKPNGKVVLVDQLCGMAILRGADVFVPGVLCMPKGRKQATVIYQMQKFRTLDVLMKIVSVHRFYTLFSAHIGLKKKDDVAVYVHVSGKCLKGMLKFEGEKMFVGNATALVSRDDIFKSKIQKGAALKMKETPFFAPCLDNVLPDKIFMQNLPSIVVGHVLDPQPGEMVLDMCAAPGGKLLHLYALMNGKGKLIGVDRSLRRSNKIFSNIKKMQIPVTNIEILTADSRELCNEDFEGDNKFKYKSFDRILLDAPCSALGQRPRLIIADTEQITSHSTLQKQLFSTAVKLLKQGGTLVYSTCTTTVEENEGLVEWAIQQHKSITLAKQEPHLGGFGRQNHTSLTPEQLKCLQFYQLPEAISLDDFSKYTQTSNPQPTAGTCENEKTLPEHDTIGFFIAKFVKA